MSNYKQKVCLSETVGGKEISIDTGSIAKQAGGAVTTKLGGTVLLTTATCSSYDKPFNFIPMTVEYRERTYAAGKIPGGFFKREARPRDKETLYARMTDRPIRPLLPKSWRRDTMIYSLLISMDGKNDGGPLSMTGASCALLLSDLPFTEAVAGVRIARNAETKEWVLFPTFEERENVDVEMIVAGKKGAVLMVEGGATQVPEAVVLEALTKAQEAIEKLCDLQYRVVEEAKKQGRVIEKIKVEEQAVPEPVTGWVREKATEDVKKHLHKGYKEKNALGDALGTIKDALVEEWEKTHAGNEENLEQTKLIGNILGDIKAEEGRKMIIDEGVRTDGRKLDEVRAISIDTDVLPCTHGSTVFTRGETQALVTTTLGTPGDAQVMDELEGDYKDRFMLHYNFPGWSVGEVKPERGPGRREIGHGTLAKRALVSLLPDQDDFPYTIRIVSDITESNGSSSMASVCGGSLAMFDAGVPLKAACAGVAMGLMMEGDKYAILTDIAGLEDHVGDMDFKVAGTREGITAVQMDIKVNGLKLEVLEKALTQALQGRLHILDKMAEAMETPRAELSQNAPRLLRLQIPVAKIGALIGPGGKNIRRMIEEYSVEIDVEDDGSVFVGGVDAGSVAQAKAEIEGMTAEPEIGKIYKGRVVSCVEFGAFVEIMPGREGLLHISQIDVNRVDKVTDVLTEGQEIEVKCLECSPEGKIRLSRKAVIKPGSELEGGGGGAPRRDSRGGGRDRDKRGGGGGRDRGRGPRPQTSRR
jgi:polyribonucleotide nucleotidyltransferase